MQTGVMINRCQCGDTVGSCMATERACIFVIRSRKLVRIDDSRKFSYETLKEVTRVIELEMEARNIKFA